MAALTIHHVGTEDLEELLALMRDYCDFYGTSPADSQLRALSAALLADPEHEGRQLIARDGDGRAIGFATLYWSWATTIAARIGTMNDLFVSSGARGSGVGAALIAACHEECVTHGARRMEWQTAPANLRAQAVYERVGATRDEWVDYWMAASDE